MLQLSLQPIITGATKKAQIAQDIFDQTNSFDHAQRARILTQLKRACDIALNEIPMEQRIITVLNEKGEEVQKEIDIFLSDLALEQVQEELQADHRDSGKTLIDGASYTVNIKEKWDLNKVEHIRHASAKSWREWDALQADLKEQSSTCTRKKADAVADYKKAYPEEQPTSTEVTLSIAD